MAEASRQEAEALVSQETGEPDKKPEDPVEWLSPRCKYNKIKIAMAVFLVVWVVCGWWLFASMGHGPAEILYILAQIVTTVGYGDFVPETKAQRLSCSFIVLGSVLIVANAIMLGIDSLLDAEAALLQQNLADKQEEIINYKEAEKQRASPGLNDRSISLSLMELGKEEKRHKEKKKIRDLVANALIWLLFLVIGTLFFGYFEACTCSYSFSEVPDCVQETQKECRESGGYVKTWADAFYMSVVTLTTVGFGDLTAETFYGRIFASIWMLLGVAATVNFIGSFSETVLNYKDEKENEALMRGLFHEHDADGDGQLSEMEFMKLQLVQLGLTTGDQFDAIQKQFHAIAGEDKQINKDEYAAFFLPEEAELIVRRPAAEEHSAASS